MEETVHDCIAAKGKQQELYETIWGLFVSDPHYKVESFIESESNKEILIQIADLFSGIAVFSKENYEKYEKWANQKVPSLFDTEETSFSNREEYRFRLLNFLDDKCKNEKLGVSLKTHRCLNTPNPNNPLNFWYYTPQSEQDKAPIKEKRKGFSL